MKINPRDRIFMQRALDLARRGLGATSPNPMVGAVVVKGDKVIAEGYHRRAGAAHAEVNALRKAGARAKNAALYVTLEPCTHFGKTPPCCDAIIEAGIKKVVVAVKDPNPVNNGKGMRLLRARGIEVVTNVLKDESEALNAPFMKSARKGLPFVTVKTAQSIDGKIATRFGDSEWISSEASRKYVHRMRSRVDAVLVGIGTVLQDDPLLSCRPRGISGKLPERQPAKIIMDSTLRVPLKARIFSSKSPGKVIVVTTPRASRHRQERLKKKGASLIVVPEKNGMVDLEQALRDICALGILHIMIEGGGMVVGSAFDAKLVDKVCIFTAPVIIGGKDAPTSVDGIGARVIADAASIRDMQVRQLGPDIVIEGEVVY